MKRSLFPVLVSLMLAAMVATTSTSGANMAEHGPSAFGAGQFRYISPRTERQELWSFSFEAIANKNGQTRGRAQFKNLTTQVELVVRINCLSVSSLFDTTVAVIGGSVLHSGDTDLPKLENVIFAASDGPLLLGSSADTITPLFPLPPFEGVADCHDAAPLTFLPVQEGDIEIQP
jgi:hypothetical protein